MSIHNICFYGEIRKISKKKMLKNWPYLELLEHMSFVAAKKKK